MKYSKLIEGIFLSRPNRFIAHVMIGGKEEICHVKNTGRLGELLIQGVEVLLEPSDNPDRKTKFSLICVKKGEQWVNIDSQVVNQLAEEWIFSGKLFADVRYLKREKTFGKSRFDFYVETELEKWYIEAKGVTLEKDGIALFPDAPTERGVKHVRELIDCVKAGYHAGILFVIQMKGIQCFKPNASRHLEFARALADAEAAGVKIMAVDCLVDHEGISIDQRIDIKL